MIRAEEIKQRISFDMLFNKLNLEPNRAGFITCPAHSDSTPSLKIYGGDRGWYCFGCNRGGTVIDFYMHYFETDFKGAVKGLASLFGIENRELSRRERVELAYKRAPLRRKEKLDEEKTYWYNKWCRYKAILEQNHTDWNPLLEEACRNIAYAEYRYDSLEEGG